MARPSDEIPRMDPVKEPRHITRVDVPRLRDRLKIDWGSSYQDRSGLENAVSVIALLLSVVTSSLIWDAHSNVGVTIAEDALAAVTYITITSALLIRIRFPHSLRHDE